MTNPFAQQGVQNGFAGAPAQAAPAETISFEFTLPADPEYEARGQTDPLPMDGFYAGRITAEKIVKDKLVLSVDLLDEDVIGKRLEKWMHHPIANPKMEWMWRGMMDSIAGKGGGKNPLPYRPGILTGQILYFRTKPGYNDAERTDIDTFITSDEHASAKAQNKHRWPRAASAAPAASPTGLPTGFPPMGAAGTGSPIPQPNPANLQVGTTPNPQAAAAFAAPAPAAAPVGVIPQPAVGGGNPFANLGKK